MTEQEAIKKINMMHEALNFQRRDADECSQALHMAIELIEKQIPMKPKFVEAERDILDMKTGEDYTYKIDEAYCSRCDSLIDNEYDDCYCSKCGQKIGWPV